MRQIGDSAGAPATIYGLLPEVLRTWDNIRAARESRTVFLSILGISWFWFYGALVLAQLPLYAKDVLGGSEEVVTAMLVHFIYRLERHGVENIPREGPALLICNHVGFADAIVISAACPRPIRFIMESIFKIPVLSALFRGMKAIAVAPAKEDPQVYERAFQIVASELRDGNLVCIFPEGRLTSDGEIGQFRSGMMRILQETPVLVVPLALSGLWDSMFSRKHGPLWNRWPRRFWPKIILKVGMPVPPEQATIEELRRRVVELRGAAR